jgi:hypothetical protein
MLFGLYEPQSGDELLLMRRRQRRGGDRVADLRLKTVLKERTLDDLGGTVLEPRVVAALGLQRHGGGHPGERVDQIEHVPPRGATVLLGVLQEALDVFLVVVDPA